MKKTLNEKEVKILHDILQKPIIFCSCEKTNKVNKRIAKQLKKLMGID